MLVNRSASDNLLTDHWSLTMIPNSFATLIRRLHAGEKARPMRWELAVSVAVIMALIGLGIAGYLLRLK